MYKSTMYQQTTVHVHVHVHVGRHPCLWCEVARHQLKIPPQDRAHIAPLRSLQSLENNYNMFTTQGKADLRKAKEYNNVIGKSFFQIPLDQVRTKSNYDCIKQLQRHAFSLTDMSAWLTHKPRHILPVVLPP